MPDRNTLTFGVEFEFALACFYGQKPIESPHDGKPPILFIKDNNSFDPSSAIFKGAAEAIQKVFHDAGLRTDITPTDNDEADGFATNGYWMLSRWTVVQDASIKYPHDLYDWTNIEINSPVFYFVPEALLAVKLVCHLLTHNFRINVNSSCGLHVHIGYRNHGFKFSTIRNLMGFIYTFNPVLLTIHPAHREDSGFAQNIRVHSIVARELLKDANALIGLHDEENEAYSRSNPKTSVAEALRRIFATVDDFNILHELTAIGTGYAMAVNLNNLVAQEESSYKVTVEFRQHAATLNGDRVAAWVQVVAGLMEWSRDVDPAEYTELIARFAIEQDEENPPPLPKLWELLQHLGLHEPARFYRARLWDSGRETEEHVLPPTPRTVFCYNHPGATLGGFSFNSVEFGYSHSNQSDDSNEPDDADKRTLIPLANELSEAGADSLQKSDLDDSDLEELNKPWAVIESYTLPSGHTFIPPSDILWRPNVTGSR